MELSGVSQNLIARRELLLHASEARDELNNASVE
jgi:hypothetical protein